MINKTINIGHVSRILYLFHIFFLKFFSLAMLAYHSAAVTAAATTIHQTVMNPESTSATWPIFNQRDVKTDHHSVRQNIGESLPALVEKSENFMCSRKWSP